MRMELTTLIHRARAADLDAFTELTRRYQNLAFGYAFSLLGDFHLAQDAVQAGEARLGRAADSAGGRAPGSSPPTSA